MVVNREGSRVKGGDKKKGLTKRGGYFQIKQTDARVGFWILKTEVNTTSGSRGNINHTL